MLFFHDGSNAYIQNTTGTLNIRPKSGENGIVLTADADVKIYYDNSQRLITTNEGVNVSGMMSANAGIAVTGGMWEGAFILSLIHI